MEYRQLGRSGLQVSAIGLGTNNFGRRVDKRGTEIVINHALDVGINMIDTSNSYSAGLSEEFIGNALKGKRQRAIIATKVSSRMADGPNNAGNSRQHIITEVENSLRRLGTDYIDLYQMHWSDPNTPIEETLRALDDLVHQGKVRYIGCSNFMAWQLCEAVWTSRTQGLTSFVSVQPKYSIMDREVEAELAPFCKEYGVGILPYYPLANGFLTGKYHRGEGAPEGTRLAESDRGMLTEKNFDMLEALEAFASKRDHTVLELAFAWLLANPAVSSVIAGATKAEQVIGNAKTVGWQLTSEEMEELRAIIK
ncbi:MAG: aldo/keto reductase [Chloroflexi bacterium]|nr:aldo/keto reductase [Chloroflexota bacterium]MDA1228889.1 aldo/keto reductase [Chloroflexota bacterium]